MSRFAPVCPLPVAEALWGMGLLGDYHLLLAHDVLVPTNSDEYRSLYSDRMRAKFKDTVVIMDNSVVELGHAMPFEQVSRAAQICDADYIVAQDSFLDKVATLEAARAFYAEACTSKGRGLYTPPLMGVVQGRNVRECLDVADYYAGSELFRGIAVPRCLTPVLGSRIPLLLELYKRHASRFDCWHLLGFSEDIFDDLAAARLPFVSGIDSAAPVRGSLAKHKVTLPYCDFGPRGRFWESTHYQTMESHAYMRYNLQLLRSLITISPQ